MIYDVSYLSYMFNQAPLFARGRGGMPTDSERYTGRRFCLMFYTTYDCTNLMDQIRDNLCVCVHISLNNITVNKIGDAPIRRTPPVCTRAHQSSKDNDVASSLGRYLSYNAWSDSDLQDYCLKHNWSDAGTNLPHINNNDFFVGECPVHVSSDQGLQTVSPQTNVSRVCHGKTVRVANVR